MADPTQDGKPPAGAESTEHRVAISCGASRDQDLADHRLRMDALISALGRFLAVAADRLVLLDIGDAQPGGVSTAIRDFPPLVGDAVIRLTQAMVDIDEAWPDAESFDYFFVSNSRWCPVAVE